MNGPSAPRRETARELHCAQLAPRRGLVADPGIYPKIGWARPVDRSPGPIGLAGVRRSECGSREFRDLGRVRRTSGTDPWLLTDTPITPLCHGGGPRRQRAPSSIQPRQSGKSIVVTGGPLGRASQGRLRRSATCSKWRALRDRAWRYARRHIHSRTAGRCQGGTRAGSARYRRICADTRRAIHQPTPGVMRLLQ